MSIIQQVPWRAQPQVPVGVDRGNPLTAGIVMHIPFHPAWGMRDIVKNNPVTKTGLASTNVSSRGIAPLFGASNYADLTDTTGVINLTDPVTIAWVQKFVSPASSSTVLVWKPSAAARTALVGYQSTLSGYRFSFGTSVNEWNLGAVASPVDGEERVCVVVCRAGLESATASDFSIYINGVNQGTPAGTTFGALTTAGMRVGATLAGADPFEGGISRLTIWNRPLLEKEVLGWSANPDGIYQSQTRRIWVPTSTSGTSYTITPSGGVVIGGTSVDIKGKILTVSGGVSMGGDGSMTFASGGTTYTITPSGGVVFAGTGNSINSKVFLPSGGITMGGTSDMVKTKIISPADGVLLGGTGSMTSNTTVITGTVGERTKVGAGT